VYSDSVSGQYFRPIRGGTYDLEFTAPGYFDKRMDNLLISDFMAAEIDVQLEKHQTSIEDNNQNDLIINLLSNPFNESLIASVTSGRQLTACYYLVDLYGRQVTHPVKTVLQTGNNPIRIDASGLSPGYYVLHLTTPSREINTIVVKM